MKANHLSETELQQYVLDNASCEKGILDHVNKCENCRTAAANYQQLFTAIKEQPKPVFNFDISALVLNQLPVQERSGNSFWINTLIAVSAAIAGVPLYLFRKSLLNVIGNISPAFIYCMAATSLAVILFRLMSMYKSYQKKIDSLNFH